MRKREHINQSQRNPRKPFIDHVFELRQRFFWCFLFFLLASALGYTFHQTLLTWLLYPLKQTLYYTSPGGGLNLVIQVCLLFGFFLSLPVFIYHIYRFIEPVFSHHTSHIITRLLISSIVLTILGICFAYFIALPAALFFLSGFSTDQVKSLITTNEYFSFATHYLVGFVLLFHLPLILLGINYVSPLRTRQLLQKARLVIVISFIVAAIMTPTPDLFNQAIIALPVILLYYFSVCIIWYTNRKVTKNNFKA